MTEDWYVVCLNDDCDTEFEAKEREETAVNEATMHNLQTEHATVATQDPENLEPAEIDAEEPDRDDLSALDATIPEDLDLAGDPPEPEHDQEEGNDDE